MNYQITKLLELFEAIDFSKTPADKIIDIIKFKAGLIECGAELCPYIQDHSRLENIKSKPWNKKH